MSKLHPNINYTLLSTHSDPESEKMTQKLENINEVMKDVNLVNLFVTESDSRDCCDVSTEMKHKSERKRSLHENITTVVHILIFQFVVFILYLSFSQEIELFTWHPILLSVGWSLFMTEGVLAISDGNWFTKFVSARNKVLVHWVLEVYAAACILAGFIIVIVNKNLKNKEHFKTWHATMGLVSVIFFIPTCLLGVLTLYKVDLRLYINPKLNKMIHIFFGSGTLILGVITVILSLYSNWFVKKTNFIAQVLCFVAVMVISLWVLVRPIKILSRGLLQR